MSASSAISSRGRRLALGLGLVLLPVAGRAARHLFLDPASLSEIEHAALQVNAPQSREAVMRPVKPWEMNSIGAFVTVRDEAGLLRMWYCCKDRAGRLFLAYAESRDGVQWERPVLGIFDYNGSRDNNIVLEQFWEGTPFLDPHASSSGEKYVYLGHGGEKGFYRFTSPDGLRWKKDERPLLPFRVDTHDVAFWDESLGRYVLYLRGWDVPGAWDDRRRKVVRLTLETLATPAAIVPSGKGDNPRNRKDLPRIVDEAPTVLTTDGLDPGNVDVYNSAVQPYPPDPGWYVGFPSFFRRDSLVDGRLEVQFAGSRDGITWHRYDHAPYVAPGLAGSTSANRTYMGVGLVVRGDELWQYGVSYRSAHGGVDTKQTEIEDRAPPPAKTEPAPDGTLYRYIQRVDGFVSLDFALGGGRAVTAPVAVDGPRLRLNADTGALGDLRVELVGSDGKVIPGFSAGECDPIETNSVRALVSWRGRSDLSALLGREVRVRFTGARAKLYSFAFGPVR